MNDSIDFNKLSELLNNNLIRTADSFNFDDDFFENPKPISLSFSKEINTTNNALTFKKPKEEKKEEENEDENENLGLSNIGQENIEENNGYGQQEEDEESNIDINEPIRKDYLMTANNILNRFNFTPKLKELLRVVIALQQQYPAIIGTYFNKPEDIAEHIVRCITEYSKQYNIFVDPNDNKTQANADFLACLQDGTIRDILKADEYFPQGQMLARQMFEILEENMCEPDFAELLLKAVQEQNRLYYEQTDTQHRRSTNIQLIQDHINNEVMYANDLIKHDDNIPAKNINDLTDREINLLLHPPAQLTTSQSAERINLFKQLKNSFNLNNSATEEDITKRLAVVAKNELIGFIEHITKQLEKFIYHRDLYVIKDAEKLKTFRTQINEFKQQMENAHTYIDYNNIYKNLRKLYSGTYNNLRFPTKNEIIKKRRIEQGKDTERSKRKTRHVEFNPQQSMTRAINVGDNPLYTKIENYMVYDCENGTNQLNDEEGGLFERANSWLLRYREYLMGSSKDKKGIKAADKFKADVKKFAKYILNQLHGILNNDAKLINKLPPVTVDMLADDLEHWYCAHITLDMSKYFNMLKRACRNGFQIFWSKYFMDPGAIIGRPGDKKYQYKVSEDDDF